MLRPESLEGDVNGQLNLAFSELLANVRLPDILERLGGKPFLEAMFALTIAELSLERKLRLVVAGYGRMSSITERLAKLWINRAPLKERTLLERVLKEAGLYYPSKA